jgi:hypothetical protein
MKALSQCCKWFVIFPSLLMHGEKNHGLFLEKAVARKKSAAKTIQIDSGERCFLYEHPVGVLESSAVRKRWEKLPKSSLSPRGAA